MTKVTARLKTALADRYTGDSQKALEYYARLVELWNDADEELQPGVRDRRARIARLVAEH